MPEPTLFTAFTKMMDRLGITPQPTDRDPFGISSSRQLMTALERVRDFPLDHLPEIEEWCKEHDVRKGETIIREMSARMAQGKLAAKKEDPGVEDDAVWTRHLSLLDTQLVVAKNRAVLHAGAVEKSDPSLEAVPLPYSRCTKTLHRDAGCPLIDYGIYQNKRASETEREEMRKIVKEGFAYGQQT